LFQAARAENPANPRLTPPCQPTLDVVTISLKNFAQIAQNDTKCRNLRENATLTRSGLLPILWLLLKKREARFGEFVTDLQIPRKTLARRLIELVDLKLVKLEVRQDAKGKGYHVYALTNQGLRLTKRIGPAVVERFIHAQKALAKAEQSLLQSTRISSNSVSKDTR
jgi:DNA-binding HxlR family transcriptional regulator